MTALSIMRRLAAVSGRLDKEQILYDAFMSGEVEFFRGVQMAYDTLISYGVKQVAEIIEDNGAASQFTWNDFIFLTSRLQKRELTGNAARDALHVAAGACDMPTWNEFYRRILLKDLGVGVTDSTVNKVLDKLASAYPEAQKYKVPVFAVQLAPSGTEPLDSKRFKGQKYLDVKLDGARLATILDKENKTVQQYSRDGRLVENFTDITTALMNLLDELPGSVVLDGEVVSESFQDLMSQFSRKSDVNTSSARLAAFDIVPLADFRLGHSPMTQQERHIVLASLADSGVLKKTVGDLVYVLPKVLVDFDTPEGWKSFADFNKEATDAIDARLLAGKKGIIEGTMVKDPNAPYTCSRNSNWLKVKPTISVSLTIVGLEEGKADGKYKGTLGGLVCAGEDDGKTIEVVCGGGLTDDMRNDFWSRPQELIGMVVELEADGLTRAKNKDTWSLRFPRLKGFRGTVPGEKI